MDLIDLVTDVIELGSEGQRTPPAQGPPIAPAPTQESRLWRLAAEKTVEATIWLGARIGLILAVIGIAYIIGNPVDEIIRKIRDTDVSQLRRDEQIKQIQSLNELLRLAEDDVRDFRTVIAEAREGHMERIGDHQLNLARRSNQALVEQFTHRSVALDDQFEDSIFDLTQEIGASLDVFDRARQGGAHHGADADILAQEGRREVQVRSALVAKLREQLRAAHASALAALAPSNRGRGGL